MALLSGLFHPGRAIPPSRPACLLKHSTHDAEPPSVWQWSPAAHLWSYHGVPAPSGSGAAVTYEARVQEDEAPGGQVEEDEGKESDRFPAEIALYLQQRLGHAGSPCCSDTLSQRWKLIKQKNQHQLSLFPPHSPTGPQLKWRKRQLKCLNPVWRSSKQ